EWVHVQLHQQKGMISLSPPTICNSAVMGALAEMERELIVERTKAGLEAARAQGRIGGRRPKLTPEQWAQAGRLIASGVPRQKVAIIYDVGVSTLYKKFPVGDK
ncbi:recombinase family protein, partial [Salmonella enterica]|uniref:recombinase family protein n=1 Tax=Salmonella enterica TaxID=28901 RepID=UPI0039063990